MLGAGAAYVNVTCARDLSYCHAMSSHRAPPDFADLDVFLGDEHRALSSRVRSALEKHDPDLHDPAAVARALARGNFFSLVAPKVDVRSLCIAREALGYVSPLADSVFAVQGLGSHPIVLAENHPGRDDILREVAKGERICAFALTEPEAGSDVASIKTIARRTDAGWRIDGEKVFISNVGIAHHYVVFANADPSQGKKGISAFVVMHDAPGLSLSPIPMSVGHPLGRLVMKDCPGEPIGDIGRGMRLALGTLDVFRTSVGAAACGMARRALDETIVRVKTREQFGKKLAELQLTQAAVAEMATELVAARLLVYRAAHLKDRGERASVEVAMAKMQATESAQRIIDRAVQLHGGLGVTSSIVERLYREIRPLRIYEGTTEIQKLIIGGALLG
jgi:acyl-CoA dehydrogenase